MDNKDNKQKSKPKFTKEQVKELKDERFKSRRGIITK